MLKRREYLKFIYGFKRYLFFLGVLIVSGIGINSYVPIVYGNLIDCISNKEKEHFIFNILLYSIISLLVILLSAVEDIIVEYIVGKMIVFHQNNLFDKILKTQSYEIEKVDLGIIISNLTSDIATIILFNVELITTIVFILLNVVVSIIVVLAINIELSVILFVFIPFYVLIYCLFKNRKKLLFKQKLESDDLYYQYICNSIKNVENIKMYNLQKTEKNKFNNIINKTYRSSLKKQKLDSLVITLNSAYMSVFSSLIMYVAAELIFNKEISLGILISFNIYATRIFGGFDSIQKLKFDEQNVMVSLERVKHIVDLPIDRDIVNVSILNVSDIAFDSVSFSYNEDIDVIDGFNLKINGNGVHTIVGSNGVGKTTLIKLVAGLYRPKNGKIFVNHISYNDLTEAEIRSYITYVAKEPFIMEESILKNILVNGVEDKVEVDRLCKILGLEEFINTLPDRIDTKLSCCNDILSSGIKQKINFIRAVCNKAPVMIFDEVTSDVDLFSEIRMCEIMRELSRDRIIITVSHRLQVMMQSDIVYFLSKGGVVSQGTFDHLKEVDRNFKEFLCENNIYDDKKSGIMYN